MGSIDIKSVAKRKRSGNANSRPRKLVKTADELPWRTVSRASATGFEGDDGMLDLEEVDDVEVVYEETANGRVAKFRVRGFIRLC